MASSSGGAHALELIRDADTAMYKAKGSGRNAYALFDTSLRDQVRDIGCDELDGFEALMRWNSSELGFVSPVEFIPIAEEPCTCSASRSASTTSAPATRRSATCTAFPSAS